MKFLDMTKQELKFVTLLYVLIALVLFFANCGGQGTTIVGNPSGNSTQKTITMGQLSSDGTTVVQMSVAVFTDDASDFGGASLSVEVDEVAQVSLTNLDAESLYDESTNTVQFQLSNLTSGNVITFLITNNQGVLSSFSGAVSATAAVTLTEETILSSSDPETLDADTDSVELALAAIIDATCEQITTCFGVITESACETGVLNSENFTEELGLASTDGVNTAQDVIDAAGAGFASNDSVVSTCVSDLSALSCVEIGYGFDSSDPSNYENIENFIPESCATAFVEL